jgi:hypothetical protein
MARGRSGRPTSASGRAASRWSGGQRHEPVESGCPASVDVLNGSDVALRTDGSAVARDPAGATQSCGPGTDGTAVPLEAANLR